MVRSLQKRTAPGTEANIPSVGPWERDLFSGSRAPEWGFPDRNRERLLSGEGSASGLGPILTTVLSGLVGTASCFMKSLLLAGSCLPAVWAGAQYRRRRFQARTWSWNHTRKEHDCFLADKAGPFSSFFSLFFFKQFSCLVPLCTCWVYGHACDIL